MSVTSNRYSQNESPLIKDNFLGYHKGPLCQENVFWEWLLSVFWLFYILCLIVCDNLKLLYGFIKNCI